MNKIWYPGFCESHGALKVHGLAHALPAAAFGLAAVFNKADAAGVRRAYTDSQTLVARGVMAGTIANIGLNCAVLRNRNIGLSRGARLVKAAQLAGFAAPFVVRAACALMAHKKRKPLPLLR